MAYHHTQVAWLLPVITLPPALVALWFAWREHPDVRLVVLVVLLLLVLTSWTFTRLHTSVVHGTLRKAFGAGWPSREEDLAGVASVRVVRNPWFYGWGIRITPHGWLWNVWGLDAVEIERKNGSRFRVGTDDPRGLARAIEAELGRLHG